MTMQTFFDGQIRTVLVSTKINLSTRVDLPIIEDWESGDFSNWTDDGNWFIDTDSYEGTYASFREPAGGSTNIEIVYTGDVQTPEQGDTFSWWQQHDTRERAGILLYWCGQSDTFDNCYRAYYEFGRDGNIRIQKLSGGSVASETVNSAPTVSTLGWHRCILDHGNDGSMMFTAEEDDETQIASVSFTDTEYTSGKLGQSSFGDTYMDLLKYQ